jgi:hypothetical protein
LPGAQHFSIDNFMDAGFYDELVATSFRTRTSERPEAVAQTPASENDTAVAEDTVAVSPEQILLRRPGNDER